MADVSAAALREFLLGRSSDAAIEAIGERLMSDEAFGDEVAEVEDGLIAAYLDGSLPGVDRVAFEAHYLATAGHRARVETRRALAARPAASTTVDDAAARRVRFGTARWLGLAAMVLLTVGLYRMRPMAPVPERTSPAGETAPSPAAPPPAAMPSVALTLSAIRTTRSSGAVATVAVPRGTAMVHLRCTGDLPPAAGLTAELVALDRDEVKRWPVDDAPAGDDDATRVVSVPPYVLPPGDYVLTLWAGDADIVQRYAFRVLP
jgi:hypothetical protein